MTVPSAADVAEAYIVFSVAGTYYALASGAVKHMEMVEAVTRVPNAPEHVDGVVFSRGQVVPALNLRVRFGFERAAYDLRSRLIVVQAGERQIGLIVDEAREFVRIRSSAIQPPQEAMAGLDGDYVAGIASLDGRLIVVLDLDRLMAFSAPLPTV
jgi:purine-binding chemotaxis protein CheW